MSDLHRRGPDRKCLWCGKGMLWYILPKAAEYHDDCLKAKVLTASR